MAANPHAIAVARVIGYALTMTTQTNPGHLAFDGLFSVMTERFPSNGRHITLGILILPRATMKILASILVFAITLSGCATVTSMYADCESKHQLFTEVTQCTKSALKSDSRYSFHKGYQANASRAAAALDFLEEKVATGAMSEKEARFRVQEILAAMRAQDMAEFEAITANNPAFQRSPTVRTTCNTFSGTTNCTSR